MGDLDAFSDTGKHDGMLTDNITCADGLETNRLAITFSCNPLPAIDGTFLQVAPKGIGNDPAEDAVS
jgi:hypothetical protein